MGERSSEQLRSLGAESAGSFAPTARTRIRRVPQRARYEREVVHGILDRALVAHVAFVHQGEPFVLPMAFARVGDRILLHGSTRARMMELLGGGARVSIAVTLLDGLVLARSAFHHSMNYRSVTVFGVGRIVEGDEARRAALAALVEKIVPGRWEGSRPPNEQELRATAIVEVPIEEAAAKVRTGGPLDDPEDLALPFWAGVIPLAPAVGEPEPDPALAPGIELPAEVRRLRDRLAG